MEKLSLSEQSPIDALDQQLTRAGIDTSVWGIGQAKTVAHLQREIESGEAVLITTETGELLRRVMVGGVDVYYNSPDGKKYRLKEDRQVFVGGRERRRDLGQAVSEKMKPDEDPTKAMLRGMQEELGITSDVVLIEIGKGVRQDSSPSYPGLKSEYITYSFEAVLTDEQFNPDGYVEHQSDKSTYFAWESGA